MVVNKEAIEKAVAIINRRIEKKTHTLNWYWGRFKQSKICCHEWNEIKEMCNEDLINLNDLLERAKRGERMKLNWIEVN